MKKTLHFIALATMLMGLVFASCSKDEDGKSSNGNSTEQGDTIPQPIPDPGQDTTQPDPQPQPLDFWVDLDLPSGLLWARCNLGANTPEEYGDYYAWGETFTKEVYDWSTYSHCNGNKRQLTKYCSHSHYGYNGFTDDLTVLQAIDDAATAVLGGSARIPTREEWKELKENTSAEWTTENGVYGRKYTGSNGNTLFLPATGRRDGNELTNDGVYSYYWSATLDTEHPYFAWGFHSAENIYDRCLGYPVRAVSQK